MNFQDSSSPDSTQLNDSYEIGDHRNQQETLSIEETYQKVPWTLPNSDCTRCTGSSGNCKPLSSLVPPVIESFKSFKFGHSRAKSDTRGTNFGLLMSKTLSHGTLPNGAADRDTGHTGYFKGHHKSKSSGYAQLKFALPPAKLPTRLEANSNTSLDLDTKAKDVCFPQPRNPCKRSGIDFDELNKFAKIDQEIGYTYRNYYRPAVSYYQSTNRPFVPEAMVQIPTKDTPDYDMKDVASPINMKFASTTSSSSTDDWTESKNYKHEDAYERRNSFTMDRFSFFAMDSDCTIHAPDISSLTQDSSFEDLFDSSKGTWWLDCLDPTDKEMSTLAKAFGIHPLTAEDIRTKETREKVELFKRYYFVCFHTFESDSTSDGFLEPVNVYLVVFREGILTFHFSPIQHPGNVRRRIRQLRDYVKVSSDWICYAIIDDITDGFVPIIREIEIETDVIEDSVFVARESDFTPILYRIGNARQRVMIMLRLLSGKADVIKMFSKRCNEQSGNAPRTEIGLYLGDIQDHIITMQQNLSVYEKIFSRSHANYLAQLQVESVNSNNRITKVLGRVTLIGTILVPLNLVTGLFGMNVRVPGQGGPDLKWFFGIIGFIVAVIILFSLIANKWLGEAESEGEPVSPGTRASRRTPSSAHASRMVRVISS